MGRWSIRVNLRWGSQMVHGTTSKRTAVKWVKARNGKITSISEETKVIYFDEAGQSGDDL